MYRKIRDWMVSVYAGHVWARAEKLLFNFTGAKAEADKAVAKLNEFRLKLPKLIAREKPFRLALPGPWPWSWAAEPLDVRDDEEAQWKVTIKPFGMSKYRRWFADETLEADLNGLFKKAERWMREVSANPGSLADLPPDTKIPALRRTKDRYVSLVRLIKLAKTLAPKPKYYKAKAKRVFDVDLRG